jgi:hypothetical protein
MESGHWPGDPEKQFVRTLNFVAILSALHAIASGTYQDAELDLYHHLDVNGDRMLDLIVRGVMLTHPSGWSHQGDIGISFDPSVRDMGVIKEVGDLSTHGALHTVEANARRLSAELVARDTRIDLRQFFSVLQLPYPGM